nr:DUF4348 domain-containing protein [Bacteroidaceae bacterium]
ISLESDDAETTQTDHIAKEEWFEFKSEIPFFNDVLVNINYGQTCISQNRKTILMEGLSSNLFMKFRFDKTGDVWKLIEIDN